MRVLVVLALFVAGIAHAQPPPNWRSGQGWDVGLETFEERRREMFAEHDERVREMNREFEESKAKSESEFRTFTAVVFGFFGLILVGGLVAGASTKQRRLAYQGPPLRDDIPVVSMAPFTQSGTVDVTSLRIGIDGRASKFVRSELEAIAKTYAGNDSETRARKLREVGIMLRRVRDSWVYGGADNEPLRSRDEAIAAFARLVDDARSRVRRSVPQVNRPVVPPVTMILVSVIVAARGELMTVTDLATGEDLRRALESAAHRAADEILALDVIWVPDTDAEQVTSIDLESVYRRAELHPLEGATVGKVFCTYCNGPFPAELVSCPHCGGPAPGRERHA